MPRPRYIVYPGFVESKTDGQAHYISASQLMVLHGVPHTQCIVINGPKDLYKLRGLHEGSFIRLFPRFDGNYKKYDQETTLPNKEASSD